MESGFPNIRHMRVFVEASRMGSVSKAAELCHLSQPAATQAISRLEQDLNATLLVRRRNQFALTPSGTVFELRARTALQHLEAGAKSALKSTGSKNTRRSSFDRLVTSAQLRNLIAIANTGSFAVAARGLGLSQPSVHRAARSLEEVAGIRFFAAHPTGVTLTKAAEALVLSTKLALSEIRQGIEEISREQGEDKGTFVLGSLPLARTLIVPKAVHAMVSKTSSVQVRVVDGRYGELLRSLREGDLDCLIGALRYPLPADDVEQEVLFRDALVIVAHPKHPLAKRKEINLEDTLAFPWIAPPKETPAGQYLFDTLRIHERATTPVRAVSSSMMMLRGLLAEGDYISIVSQHQISIDQELGTIAPLNIALEGQFRDIGLTFRRNWRPTDTQARFIDLLQRFSAL